MYKKINHHVAVTTDLVTEMREVNGVGNHGDDDDDERIRTICSREAHEK